MRPGKFLALCCIGFIAAQSAVAQSAPAVLTLNYCVETALKNNIEVKRAGFENERDYVDLRAARGQMLPSLIGDVRHSLNQGRSIDYATNGYTNNSNTLAFVSLNADLTIFNGFRLLNNLKSTQYLYEAGKMQWQQQRDQLTLDVILAYLDVLTNMDILSQMEQQKTVTQKQAERLAILNNEGAIKPSDYYDMKGQLAGNEVSIVNTRNQLNASRLKLAQLMNITFDDRLEVERIPLEAFDLGYSTTVDSVYQTAMEEMALVKSVDLLFKSSDKAVKAAKGGLLPTLSIGAGYNTNYSKNFLDTDNKKVPYFDQLKNNRSTNAGIGVNIPLMNGFYARNILSRAKINQKEAEYMVEYTRIQLRQLIERDYLNMTATLSRYKALQDQVVSYVENFRAAEVRFNNGATNSVDYLIAKNKMDNSNIDLIIARYEFLLRTKILDYYQGKLKW